jgi:hypothetical protein
VVALQTTPNQHNSYTISEASVLLLGFSEAKLKPEAFKMQVFNPEAVPLIFGLTAMQGYQWNRSPFPFRPVTILISRCILRILLHLFLIKSTTLRATKKCAHFQPERISTGNKPELCVCCRGRGATS